MIVSFFTIPLSLTFLENEKYGIWLTLSSILGWLSFFDLGLTNGLRNELGKSFAQADYHSAKKDISNNFFVLFFIFFIITILLFIMNHFINWHSVLNTKHELNYEIQTTASILLLSLLINITTGIVFTVLSSDQNSIIPELFRTASTILTFVTIYFLNSHYTNSLIFLSFSFSVISSFLSLCFFIYFFSTKYNKIRPSIIFFDIRGVKKIFKTSVTFFVIQISALILFMTDNFIISKLFSPADVVPYNISYKLFNLIVILFGIIVTPLWASFNNAHHMNDKEWIINIIKKLKQIWIKFMLVLFVLFLLSEVIYKYWLGNKVEVGYFTSFSMALFVAIHTFNSIYVTYIFSTGKIRVQTLMAIIAALINLPLSFFLAKYLNIGPPGVIISTAICSFPNIIISRYQFNLLVNEIDKGIWSK